MPQQPSGNFTADFLETYVVGAATPESHQYVAVFLPNPAIHPRPADGYPVLVGSNAGGFATIGASTTIPFTGLGSSVLAWRLLHELGMAVVVVGLTGTFTDQAGTLNTASNGRGIFHPPGTAGWADDLRYSAQKEAVLAVQLLRERAGTWGVDADRIVVEGGSSAGCAFVAPAFWPDQADPSKDDHRRQSSRVRAMRLRIPQTDWKLYDPAEPAPSNFNCFPDAGGDVTTDLCPTFGDAPSSPVDYLRWASAMRIGLDTAVARQRVASKFSIWIHSHEGGQNVTDLSLAGDWGESTGKTSVEVGTVDPVTTAARHEAAHALLLFKALREIEVDLWHTRNSRLIVDQATYDYAFAIDAEWAELVADVFSYNTVDPDLQNAEIAWLSNVVVGAEPPRPIATLPKLGKGDVVDLALVTKARGIDLAVVQGDLARDTSLRSMILGSLFTDARAADDVTPADGSNDRRGFWAADEPQKFGSLLWLHSRSKLTSESAEAVRGAALDALGWLVEQRIASKVEATATIEGGRVALNVQLTRGAAPRWSSAWDDLEIEPITGPGLIVTIGV